MQYLIILKTITDLLPSLIAAITAIERAFPAGGQGQQKLESLKAMLKVIHDTSEDMDMPFEKMWEMLAPIAAAMVSLHKSANAEVTDANADATPAG